MKGQKDEHRAEIQWFTRKYLHSREPERFDWFCEGLTPDDVSRILAWGLSSGMTMTWSDDPDLQERPKKRGKP